MTALEWVATGGALSSGALLVLCATLMARISRLENITDERTRFTLTDHQCDIEMLTDRWRHLDKELAKVSARVESLQQGGPYR